MIMEAVGYRLPATRDTSSGQIKRKSKRKVLQEAKGTFRSRMVSRNGWGGMGQK